MGEGRLSGVHGCEDRGTVHADGLRARVLGGPGRTEVLEEDSEAEEEDDEDEGKSEVVGPGIPIRAQSWQRGWPPVDWGERWGGIISREWNLSKETRRRRDQL